MIIFTWDSVLIGSRGLVNEENIRSPIEEHEQLVKAMRLCGRKLASILMGRGTPQRFQTSRTDLKLVEGCPDHLV